MHAYYKRAALLGLLLFVLGTDAALSDGGIPIRIVNDTNDEVVVTVIDMNASPQQPVISNQRIYGSASLSIQIAPDAQGYGHVKWTALAGDPANRTCGHKEKMHLNPNDVVRVSANDDCNTN